MVAQRCERYIEGVKECVKSSTSLLIPQNPSPEVQRVLLNRIKVLLTHSAPNMSMLKMFQLGDFRFGEAVK